MGFANEITSFNIAVVSFGHIRRSKRLIITHCMQADRQTAAASLHTTPAEHTLQSTIGAVTALASELLLPYG